MSGGTFNYREFNLNMLAEEMMELIETDDVVDVLPKDLLQDYVDVIKELKVLYYKAHCLDYFIAGDYGVESYYKNKEKEIDFYTNDISPLNYLQRYVDGKNE
jgi:hypothetical protein